MQARANVGKTSGGRVFAAWQVQWNLCIELNWSELSWIELNTQLNTRRTRIEFRRVAIAGRKAARASRVHVISAKTTATTNNVIPTASQRQNIIDSKIRLHFLLITKYAVYFKVCKVYSNHQRILVVILMIGVKRWIQPTSRRGGGTNQQLFCFSI